MIIISSQEAPKEVHQFLGQWLLLILAGVLIRL